MDTAYIGSSRHRTYSDMRVPVGKRANRCWYGNMRTCRTSLSPFRHERRSKHVVWTSYSLFCSSCGFFLSVLSYYEKNGIDQSRGYEALKQKAPGSFEHGAFIFKLYFFGTFFIFSCGGKSSSANFGNMTYDYEAFRIYAVGKAFNFSNFAV